MASMMEARGMPRTSSSSLKTELITLRSNIFVFLCKKFAFRRTSRFHYYLHSISEQKKTASLKVSYLFYMFLKPRSDSSRVKLVTYHTQSKFLDLAFMRCRDKTIIFQENKSACHTSSFITIDKRMIHQNLSNINSCFQESGRIKLLAKNFLFWRVFQAENSVIITHAMRTGRFINSHGVNLKNILP